MLSIKLVRSAIGCKPKQRKTLEALGLRKPHQVRDLPDSPTVRGMIERVKHLVEVSQS